MADKPTPEERDRADQLLLELRVKLCMARVLYDGLRPARLREIVEEYLAMHEGH